MKGIAFFSGGKDGLYATYLAEKRGIKIPYLLTLKTSVELSPHYENLSELRKLAEVMHKNIIVFNMTKGSEELVKLISSLNVNYIIGGDVLLQDHLDWIQKLADESGVEALEPLWGKNTMELAKEMIKEGFEYAIIAVNKNKLSKKWIGYKFHSVKDLEFFY